MTIGDAVVSLVPNNSKKCAVFDGVDDHVDIAHNNNQLFRTEFSISAWIKPTGTGEFNQGRIVDKSSGAANDFGNNGFTFLYDGDNKRVFTVINNGTIKGSNISEIDFRDGLWHHVITSISSDGNVQHYHNGVASGTPGISAALTGITTTNEISIGNRATKTDRTFKGAIADIRIYTKKLSAAEAADIAIGKKINADDTHLRNRWNFFNDDYTDAQGNDDGTNSGSRITIIDSDIAAELKLIRMSEADMYLIYPSPGKPIGVVAIQNGDPIP